MGVNRPKTIQSILKTNTNYLKRWLNILCNTKEYYRIFIGSFLDNTDLESSIFEFQAYLKYIGRGQDISIDQIKNSIDKRDNKQLKILLEELLLIPIDNIEVVKVLNITDYTDLKDFIDEIKAYSNTRYARVIDEYFCYNKAWWF